MRMAAVTGGHVYRGALLLDLEGYYVYSDWCSGWLRGFRMAGLDATETIANGKSVASRR